jgi:hypothetical protein
MAMLSETVMKWLQISHFKRLTGSVLITSGKFSRIFKSSPLNKKKKLEKGRKLMF